MLSALTVLTLAGLGIRVSGLDHLLPHLSETDAVLARQAKAFGEGRRWAPEASKMNAYPTLVSELAALAPAPAVPGVGGPPASLEAHLAAASAYHLRVRLLVALFAAALVPATFFLARRFLGAGAALIAAALVATDPLHLLFSAQARPHGVIATLSLLAVLAAMELRRRPTVGAYALAGAAAALAVAALHSGVAVLVPLLVAHLAREKEGRAAPGRRIFVPVALVTVGFAYFYRHLLLEARTTGLSGARPGALRMGGHHMSLEMFDGGGFGAMAEFLVGTNPVLAALAALGALAACAGALRRRPVLSGDALVALSFALPYFLVLGVYGRTEERFSLPLLPYFALLAALALARGIAFLRARLAPRVARGASAAVALIVLALPTLTSTKLAWLRARPDTCEQAAAFLAASLPPGAKLMLAPGLQLPLFYARESLAESEGESAVFKGMWYHYQKGLPDGARDGTALPVLLVPLVPGDPAFTDRGRILELLREFAPTCVVLEVSGYHRERPEAQSFLAAVERWGTLTVRFRPDDADDAVHRRLYCVYTERFLHRVLTARALGPELRIYRPAPSLEASRSGPLLEGK